jgi:branched-chain amino acid transport system substrate-binding protein
LKTRRQIMGLVLTAIMVIAVVVMSGCAAGPGAAGEKTLKIGANITQTWPIGLDCRKADDWYAEKINNAGGLDIGGTKYKLQLIWDDNKMDEALSKTAFQKEIFQDGCKFVLSDMWNHSCFQLA